MKNHKTSIFNLFVFSPALVLSLSKDIFERSKKSFNKFRTSAGLLLLTSLTLQCTPSIETAMEYQQNEQFSQAIACFEEIVYNEPYNLNALFSLGCCYLALGDYTKALNSFNTIIAYSPQTLPALYNKAFTYKTMGDIDTAIALYQQIIAINPEYEPAQLGLGFAYITNGDFEKGWKQHERYLKQSGKNGDALRKLLQENNIGYKKILLLPEGGLGDTLHLIRYAKVLKNMHTDVIVVCQKPLIPLLSRCSYIDQLIPSGSQAPEHDARATFMSLPAIFNDDDQTAPHNIPYLFADPALVTYWKNRLASDTNFKIGICWQADFNNDKPSKLPIARRGVPLQNFAPLAAIDGVSLYSLQKYDGTEQIGAANFKLTTFENLDEQAGPFMDTAAIINNLDLIITVDTAMVHLAGGLGAKVWLLHPYATADWRWICHRDDSYWYPDLRIFKQQKPFDYEGVIEQVYDALQKLVAI
jgi:tetratricopeptide (TPR) repeat protein